MNDAETFEAACACLDAAREASRDGKQAAMRAWAMQAKVLASSMSVRERKGDIIHAADKLIIESYR